MLSESVEKPVKSMHTRLAERAVCIIRDIPNRWSCQIFKLEYFCENLRRNWTYCSENSYKDKSSVGGRTYVALLDLFSLVPVDTFNQSCMSEGTMLVMLPNTYLESAGIPMSFQSGATKNHAEQRFQKMRF